MSAAAARRFCARRDTRLRPARFAGSGKARSLPDAQSSCAALPEMIETPSPAATRFLMLCWSSSRAATCSVRWLKPSSSKKASAHFWLPLPASRSKRGSRSRMFLTGVPSCRSFAKCGVLGVISTIRSRKKGRKTSSGDCSCAPAKPSSKRPARSCCKTPALSDCKTENTASGCCARNGGRTSGRMYADGIVDAPRRMVCSSCAQASSSWSCSSSTCTA